MEEWLTDVREREFFGELKGRDGWIVAGAFPSPHSDQGSDDFEVCVQFHDSTVEKNVGTEFKTPCPHQSVFIDPQGQTSAFRTIATKRYC